MTLAPSADLPDGDRFVDVMSRSRRNGASTAARRDQAGLLVVVALLGGCVDRRVASDPPRGAAGDATPAAPRPIAAAPPIVAPPPALRAPRATTTVLREQGRVIVSIPAAVEDLVVARLGIGWTESGSVHALFDGDDAPREIAALVDPHSLVSDGERLCWLGFETNGCHDLARDVAIPLPHVGAPGDEGALAFGDVLYARGPQGALLRFAGAKVEFLPFRPDPAWHLLTGLGAGPKLAVVAAVDTHTTKGMLVRVPVRGRVSTIELPPSSRARWDVSARGVIAFVADEQGSIATVGADASKPKIGFVQPGTTHLCWCGADVCTVADGVLRRHSGAAAVIVAEGLAQVHRLACGFGRIAWKEPLGEAGARIIAIAGR